MHQGVSLEGIAPGMPVHGVDGKPLGTVEAIDDSGVRVLNHSVPAAAIARVDAAGVHLHLAHTAFTTAGPTGTASAADASQIERFTVPVVEERLQVGTRQMQIGEAQVTKRVVEEQIMVPVTVRREEIEIIRRGPGEPREELNDPSVVEVIRIPLRGEEPVITTQAVVTSEVVVGRTVRTEQRQVTDTVRRTEVDVEEHLNEAYARLRPAFEEHFSRGSRAASLPRDFRDAETNYRAGFLAAHDQRYVGRSFEEVEPELSYRADTRQADPSMLERIREEVREGFARARTMGAR